MKFFFNSTGEAITNTKLNLSERPRSYRELANVGYNMLKKQKIKLEGAITNFLAEKNQNYMQSICIFMDMIIGWEYRVRSLGFSSHEKIMGRKTLTLEKYLMNSERILVESLTIFYNFIKKID